MSNPYGLTPRSAAHHRRDFAAQHQTWLKKYGDKTTAKYFVYFLLNTGGDPVYIGRSVNPEARLRSHRNRQGNPNGEPMDTSSWFPMVDHMEVIGPFIWDEAVQIEREEIAKHQPPANRDGTARDHRPAIAAESQKIRDEYLASKEVAA